jgi:4-amino-4-deoxy-L-arabinose transferase-like glycosyltransferase
VRRAIPSLILLIAISCGALFFRLGSLPLSGADEPRYARIAQEMGALGNWVTPRIEGKPWLEKPPLYYWLTIPAYSVFNINETAARLGPALCALITALAIFWLGSTLWSRQAGFFGAAILLTSLGFIGFGRSASTDMPFTCCLTLALAMLLAKPGVATGAAGSAGVSPNAAYYLHPAPKAPWSAVACYRLKASIDVNYGRFMRIHKGASKLAHSKGFAPGKKYAALGVSPASTAGTAAVPASPVRLLFAYVFLGFAVLAKGPVAIILAAGILLSVWYLDERGGLFHKWHVIPGVLIAAAVSIPWFWLVFKQNGFAFISTFFINHNLARYITGIHHHPQPFFYYIPVLLALLFPWSGWLPLLISRSPLQALRRWREWDIRMVFLSCWFLFPILFFSLSDSKLAGYILPSLPPLALIMGIYISRAIPNVGVGVGVGIGVGFSSLKSRLRIAAFLGLILSAGMAIAAPLVFQKDYGGAWKTGLLLSAAILIPAVFSFVYKLKGKCLQAFGATLLQGLVLVVVLAQFAFPVLGAYYSTRDIAHRALELRQSDEPIITYRFFHHSLHYYTDYQVAGKLDDAASLIEFARDYPGTLVVTNAAGMKEILSLREISAASLAEQGNFRLMRFSIRNSKFEIRD